MAQTKSVTTETNNKVDSNEQVKEETSNVSLTNESASNQAVVHSNNINQSTAPARLIDTMQEIESLANAIAKSDRFSKPFEQDVKAEDGSISTIVNVNDIIANILLAREMGLSPMQGIILGRQLDRQAMIKAQFGKELGFNVYASIKEIFIWESNGRELIYIGVHMVNAILRNAKIKQVITEYPNMKLEYRLFKTKEPIEFNSDIHVLVSGLTAEALKKQLDDGKIPVIKSYPHPSEIVARVKLIRGDDDIEIPYSLQDAIDAGLAPGTKSNGDESKGKDNWANHPRTMLIHKSTMNGARIIAADKLHGLYTSDELPQVQSNPVYEDDNQYVEEAEFKEV